jgi:HPt (histidine-containing phosphotransfer) domain-containing protein
MPPVLDHDQLDALGADLGDADFLRETVELFLAELPGRTGLINQACATSDRSALVEVAHSLGSASAMLGGAQLAAACRAIEHGAATASPAELAGLLQDWNSSCLQTEGAMRSWCGAQGSNR